jgi:hypothetical protein
MGMDDPESFTHKLCLSVDFVMSFVSLDILDAYIFDYEKPEFRKDGL